VLSVKQSVRFAFAFTLLYLIGVGTFDFTAAERPNNEASMQVSASRHCLLLLQSTTTTTTTVNVPLTEH
jgi:hypothetical protein